MADLFIHPQAIVEPGARIGRGSRIWAFAHILPGAVLGEDCNICDNVFIENQVVVGNRVTIKCGVQLWDGVNLEDDVFVGPNATFTNDPFPRSKKQLPVHPRTVIRNGASIGANATILPGITVGPHAMVGSGAVVTGNVPPNAIVIGNPARIKGYTNTVTIATSTAAKQSGSPVMTCRVKGVSVVRLPEVEDIRGWISFAEMNNGLPFQPRRYFLVYGVPGPEVRGQHAHKKVHQFLVCAHGSVSVLVDDGKIRDEVVLDTPGIAVHIPPMVWAVQYRYSADAVLMVLASETYDADDYIRDYDEYLTLVRGEPA
jgi:UDP-2-acetamido-3-amino-2,3-dideoxy-glucuronate N-acetyltransferase